MNLWKTLDKTKTVCYNKEKNACTVGGTGSTKKQKRGKTKMTLYTQEAVNNILNAYSKKSNYDIIKFDGSLLDNYIVFGDNLKTTIIKEIYLNEWSSAYSIRMYNKTPQKYQKIIDLFLDGDEEQAQTLFYRWLKMIKLFKKLFKKKYNMCYEIVTYDTKFTKTQYFYY